MRRMAGAGILGMLLSAGIFSADVIHLQDGRSLDVEGWRYEGDQIVLDISGGILTIPRSLVVRIETSAPPPPRPPRRHPPWPRRRTPGGRFRVPPAGPPGRIPFPLRPPFPVPSPTMT